MMLFYKITTVLLVVLLLTNATPAFGDERILRRKDYDNKNNLRHKLNKQNMTQITINTEEQVIIFDGLKQSRSRILEVQGLIDRASDIIVEIRNNIAELLDNKDHESSVLKLHHSLDQMKQTMLDLRIDVKQISVTSKFGGSRKEKVKTIDDLLDLQKEIVNTRKYIKTLFNEADMQLSNVPDQKMMEDVSKLLNDVIKTSGQIKELNMVGFAEGNIRDRTNEIRENFVNKRGGVHHKNNEVSSLSSTVGTPFLMFILFYTLQIVFLCVYYITPFSYAYHQI